VDECKPVLVGHTIQQPLGINAACGGRVLRVDVGMSAGCGGGRAEVLEILMDGEGGITRLSIDRKTGGVVREPVAGVPAAAPAPAAASGRGWAGGRGMFGAGLQMPPPAQGVAA